MTSQEPELDPVDVEVDEPITVTDRRRIDPETGEVRPGGAGEEEATVRSAGVM